MLQYTEQVQMFNALNFMVDIMGGSAYGAYANTTVTMMHLNILQCPSESTNGQGLYPTPNSGLFYGTSNYVGNYGGPGVMTPANGTITPANTYAIGTARNLSTGSAGLNLYPGASWAPVRMAAITDGSSNTGLVSERLLGLPYPYPQTIAAVGTTNLNRCSIHSPTGAPMGSGMAGALMMYKACSSAPGTTGIRYCGSAEQWSGGFADYLMWQSYNHFGTPNQINCTNTMDVTDGNSPWAGYYVTAIGSAPPGSLHPGGVNEAFADGSVHFIKSTIAPNTWWALGSRNLDEVVGANQY